MVRTGRLRGRELDTKEKSARRRTIENEKRTGRSKEQWVAQWKEIFDIARFVLTTRIESGEYVVLTYRVLTIEGQDMQNGLEMPVIFHKVDGSWRATQTLSSDLLVLESPWVSGQNEVEEIAE